jgi:RES domain-containing protein
MIVYRLSKASYKNDLSGKGAERAGGRWNSKGISMLYTGESRALCTAELAVHLPLGIVPKDYFMVSMEYPDSVDILAIDEKQLPADWKSFPHPHSTQEIGNRFISEGRYLVMRVPSAVVQGDHNYLFNPFHPHITELKIISTVPYSFDERLFKR